MTDDGAAGDCPERFRGFAERYNVKDWDSMHPNYIFYGDEGVKRASRRHWRRAIARLLAGIMALIIGAYGIPASAHVDSYPAVLIACTVYVVLMLYALGAIWKPE